MIDTHCHLDLYPDPSQTAREARAGGVGIIAVTNLPSAFERAYPFIGQEKGFKLALGLHPLEAKKHKRELAAFARLCDKTYYIGEVGLDLSPEGYATRDTQMASFRFVLETLRGRPRFLTIHSRRAEREVLDCLKEFNQPPGVFHWYSGPLGVLDEAVELGHYFSINPAMIASPNGQRIITRLPSERILTESDGPFVTIDGRPSIPADISLVEKHLASTWKVGDSEARQQLKRNFVRLRSALGGLGHKPSTPTATQ